MATDPLLAVLERARSWGFLGPGPVQEHVDHAAGLLEVLQGLGPDDPRRAVDLGSGGGVPGLLAAVATPAWRWVLLDSMARRTDFLRDAVRELGLEGRVEVWRERAEVAGRAEGTRGEIDVVTARSFAGPAVTAECAAPLLRPAGLLIVSEPPGADGSRWDPEGMAGLGFSTPSTSTGGWVVHRLATPAPEWAPRPVGRPAKRPLWV